MIANGSSNRCVWWWAQHLEADNNEDVRVVQTYGVAPGEVRDMLEELMDLARGTRCKNPFYEIHFSPAPGERLTESEWDRVREMVEKHHGFEGQPYFMVMHTKHGEKHAHIIYSRIDLETGKTISDSHDARTNHAIARAIEEEFGLQKVVGPYDVEPDEPRPQRAPKRWEMYRGMQTAIDPREIAAQVKALLQHSDNGPAFKAALEEQGYELVTGRRGLLILDSAGKEHSLAKRCSMKVKELDAFMREIDREALPTVEQAKAAYQERKIAALEADQATVAQEIAWEEKLALAAIEKEKLQGQFIAPEDRKTVAEVTAETNHDPDHNWDRDLASQTWEDAVIAAAIEKEKIEGQYAEPARPEKQEPWAGGKEQGKRSPMPERELNTTAGNIRIAYNVTDSPAAFREFLQQEGLTAARVTELDIHERDTTKAQQRKDDILRILHSPQDMWMLQTGGAAALSPELAGRAKDAYDIWFPRMQALRPDPFDFDSYVEYVQEKWRKLAEYHGIDLDTARQAPSPAPIERRPFGISDHARAGDVVILDKWGNVYELTPRTTGDGRQDAQAFLAGIDRNLPSIEDARREQREQRKSFVPERELNEIQGEIRLAFALSQSAAGFLQNLEELAGRPLEWEEYKGIKDPVYREEYGDLLQGNGRFRLVGDRVATIARVTKEEALESRVDHYHANHVTGFDAEHDDNRTIDDPEHVRVFREGEYVVLTERGVAYSLAAAAGRSRGEIEKFMGTAAVPTLTEARQILEEKFELQQAEYQAFRGLIEAGSLYEYEQPTLDHSGNYSLTTPTGISGGQLGQTVMLEAVDVLCAAGSVAEHATQMIELGTATAGKVLDTAANIAGEAIEMLGDMFGATAITPQRVQAASDAREQAAVQRLREWAALRAHNDQDHSRDHKRQQEITDEQRRYYERQHELDR